MAQQEVFATVGAHLAAYLPPGATETTCTIPVAEVADWLREAGAPALPPEAREVAWRVERTDWDGAGITFGDADDGA